MFLTQYERGSGAGGFCAFAVSSFCTSVDDAPIWSPIHDALIRASGLSNFL
jgi:hypothetical protein